MPMGAGTCISPRPRAGISPSAGSARQVVRWRETRTTTSQPETHRERPALVLALMVGTPEEMQAWYPRHFIALGFFLPPVIGL